MKLNLFFPLWGIVLLFFSCKDDTDFFGKKLKKFEGGNKVFRVCHAFPLKTLDFRGITTITEANIASLHLDCLFQTDLKTFTVVPNLVEKFTVDKEKKTLSIELKKGIYFHVPSHSDAEPVELTAEDVKFSFDLLCKNDEGNVQFSVIAKDRIKGAKEAYEESTKTGKLPDVSGVKVTGKYTLEFQLLNSPEAFMEVLTYPGASIISKTYYNAINRQIGTGPFIPVFKDNYSSSIHFYKNVNYFRKDKKGNPLPYLDSVVNYFTNNTDEAWLGFENGKFDLITYFPAGKLKKVIEENISSFKSNPPKYIVQRNMGFQIDYLSFNVRKYPFNNLKIRKAIAHAINKDLLIEKALYGQAYGPADHGMVPPVFKKYHTDSVIGLKFNVEEAKRLLKEAGIKDGSQLGEITLLVAKNISLNSSIAAEIQRQLKENLNINLTFESLEPHLKLLLQSQGSGHMYKDGWVADYPNPESFMACFYSKFIPEDTLAFSYPNFTRYKNPVFDEFYEKGRDVNDIELSMHFFKKADETLINDVAAIPLWYNNDYILLKSYLKNLQLSPLKIYNYAEIDKTN
ncbi:MAG: ABC transporter substrate-binding protein [Bacteroidia bacterium]|nr:ABC transporter substrate-binding protein [Bacteroidia bacterium]